jgi:hypothetical protein
VKYQGDFRRDKTAESRFLFVARLMPGPGRPDAGEDEKMDFIGSGAVLASAVELMQRPGALLLAALGGMIVSARLWRRAGTARGRRQGASRLGDHRHGGSKD